MVWRWRRWIQAIYNTYVKKVLTFGLNCAPCIAHFVRAVKAVESNHYIDNFIDSVDPEEEAIELAKSEMHASAGFHMRSWATNSPLVRKQLSDDDLEKDNCFGATEKILNMY